MRAAFLAALGLPLLLSLALDLRAGRQKRQQAQQRRIDLARKLKEQEDRHQ